MLYAIIVLLIVQLLIMTYAMACMLLCMTTTDEDYEDMLEIAKEAKIKEDGLLEYIAIKAIVSGMEDVKYCVDKLSKQEAV